MTNVVLVGTLDTKGVEYGWLRERLLRAGVEVVLVDTGIMGEPRVPADVPREAVARAAGAELSELRTAADRGAAGTTLGPGPGPTVVGRHAEGRLEAG
ncbi:Tm-1-like ATP-binding domain-containing protein, partial [Streptomyces sp. NPDC059447]|uniref:Tm-1-like ATP-binding domain-containing protein n=1 Tax=Streptomyces sp. NPDC059447 TaxID=3346834 RepID=UPI00368D83D5